MFIIRIIPVKEIFRKYAVYDLGINLQLLI